jgi:type VI secretion system secreted protein VgrG
VVQGTQTAVVVGPPGEEIFPDKYGRVKVQFHWDREGKHDLDSSCWIRVGTFWAGKQWGMIHIPRIGQEVIVDFLEGDPDQPIIIGSVYNAEQMPPYKLPDNKTQSGIKSRSSMAGGPPNFNEFRFEDKKGSEEVYLHAEKDWTIMVENDKNQTVCRDETHTVKRDRTKTVRNNEQSTIIHNRTEKVGDFESITVGKDRTLNVIQNQKVTIGQNETITVTQKKQQSIGDEYILAATNKLQESSKQIEITAGTTLTIQGPGGGIKIDASGVTIWGVLVKIN